MVLIKVWDSAVRSFHWLLVVLVATSLISGNLGGNAIEWHERSGIAILTLLLFRWIWGFAGSTTARFSHFLHRPSEVFGFLPTLFGNRPDHRAGHNPVGGWMVLILMLMLSVQVTTGLFGNDDIFFDGPLAHLITKHNSDLAITIHRFGASVLLALIALHIVAVLFHMIVRREDLVRAMFTGKRAWPDHLPQPDVRFAAPWLAPVLLILAAITVAALLWKLGI